MKILDKIFKNNDKPVIDENIALPPFNEELYDFIGVSCIQWLFNKIDKNNYTYYVYKITYYPYLYAYVQISPSKHYSIRMFSYIGLEELNEDNLFKVKRGKTQINYVINSNEMKLFGPDNKYGFSYELLWNKIINEYWKCVDKENDK